MTLAGSQVGRHLGTATCGPSPIDDFVDFDADAEPQLSFGPDTLISVDPAGRLFAYTPTTGAVRAVDTADVGTIARSWEITHLPERGAQHRSSARWAATWAVLDVDARMLDAARPRGRSHRRHRRGRRTGAADAVGGRRRGRGRPPSGTHRGRHRRRRGAHRSSTADRAPRSHRWCTRAASTRSWGTGTVWRSCAPADDRLLRTRRRHRRRGLRVHGERQCPRAQRPSQREHLGGERATTSSSTTGTSCCATQRDDEEVEQQRSADAADCREEPDSTRWPTTTRFGARPERSTLLPVILNDYDANGDVLVVDSIVGELPPWATVDLVVRQPAVAADARARGIRFGRDSITSSTTGAADRAGARRGHGPRARRELAARAEATRLRASVATGGRVTTAVLGDWVDPDGDPFFLQQATIDAPDAVSFTAEGVVVVDEGGERGGNRTVSLLVSDGRAQGVGHARGDGPRARRRPADRRPVRGARHRRAGDPHRAPAARARRHRRGRAQRGSGEARRRAHPRLRPRNGALHEQRGAHALPRVRRDRRERDGDRSRARRCLGTARPRHDAHHRAPHRVPASTSSRSTSTCWPPTSTRPAVCSWSPRSTPISRAQASRSRSSSTGS